MTPDLLALAAAHTTLRRVSATECAGPCPRCGGTDRFHVTAAWFFCRQCHPRRGDAIEFLRWLTPGLSYRAALAQLPGPQKTEFLQETPFFPSPAPPAQPPSWAASASAELARAQDTLWGPHGAAARDYLEARALQPHVWLAFRLGYNPAVGVPGTYQPGLGRHTRTAPALVMPWYRGDRLVALRYRFLAPHDGPKIASRPGSRFAGLAFGGQALDLGAADLTPQLGARYTLVLCEGEINAMSIWQVAHGTRLDVLSLGSESQRLSPGLVAHARHFGTVLTWFDKPEIAAAVALALPGAYAIASPQGKDANDWLQQGMLGGLLSAARVRACPTLPQREALLWDLWDAADRVQGIDAGTARVLQDLAASLGKPVSLYEPEPGRWITAR